MLSISSWWNVLPIEEQILWTIALSGSILLVIQIIMIFIGGDTSDMDTDGDVDTSVETDHGIPFQFLSLKNFTAFLAVFGWTGIICLNAGLGIGWSALIATFAGFIMMFIMASLMYGLYKLTEEGTVKIESAAGKSGTVYLTIPEKRSGKGQVQIKLNGLRTLDAVTDNESPIKTGQFIEVLDVENDILIVKPK
jgi:membrane protein implicated in regulation of membrane protease activity